MSLKVFGFSTGYDWGIFCAKRCPSLQSQKVKNKDELVYGSNLGLDQTLLSWN